MFKILATTVAFSLATLGIASAATVTVVDDSVQGVGNTADLYASGFGANTPLDATFSPDPTRFVPPGNENDVALSPFANTVLQEARNYFSVGGESDTGNGGALSPVTLTYTAGPVYIFDMLWGSIDSYNRIVFSLGGTNVFSYTGTQLAAAIGLTTPRTNYNHVARVVFDDFANGFDKVTFTSLSGGTDRAAFEFGLAPVPLPAGGLLLVAAIGGLAVLRRRKALAA